jgi:hypothetical protein
MARGKSRRSKLLQNGEKIRCSRAANSLICSPAQILATWAFLNLQAPTEPPAHSCRSQPVKPTKQRKIEPASLFRAAEGNRSGVPCVGRLHGSASASPASSSSPSPSSSLSLSAALTRCLPFLLHHLVRIHGCVVPIYQAGTQEMMRWRPFSSAAPKFLTPSPCFCRRRPPTSCWRRCFRGRGIAAPGPRFT